MYKRLIFNFAVIFICALNLSTQATNATESKPYCHVKQQFTPDGAIVRYGTRYFKVCSEPIVHSNGTRRGRLWLSLDEYLRLDMHETLAPSVPGVPNSQFPVMLVLDDRGFKLPTDGQFVSKVSKQTFRGVEYTSFFSSGIEPETGEPRGVQYLYVAKPSLSPLPTHYASCHVPAGIQIYKNCHLFINYFDVWVTFRVFVATDAPRFIQVEFPEIVMNVVNLLKYADVTDKCCNWPEALPVLE